MSDAKDPDAGHKKKGKDAAAAFKKADELLGLGLSKRFKGNPDVAEFQAQLKAKTDMVKNVQSGMQKLGKFIESDKGKKLIGKVLSDAGSVKLLKGVLGVAKALGPALAAGAVVLSFLEASGFIESEMDAVKKLLNEISSKIDKQTEEMKAGFKAVMRSIDGLDTSIPAVIDYNRFCTTAKDTAAPMKNMIELMQESKACVRLGRNPKAVAAHVQDYFPSPHHIRGHLDNIKHLQTLLLEGQELDRKPFFQIMLKRVRRADNIREKAKQASMLITRFEQCCHMQVQALQSIAMALQYYGYIGSDNPLRRSLLKRYKALAMIRSSPEADPSRMPIGGVYGKAPLSMLLNPVVFGGTYKSDIALACGPVRNWPGHRYPYPDGRILQYDGKSVTQGHTWCNQYVAEHGSTVSKRRVNGAKSFAKKNALRAFKVRHMDGKFYIALQTLKDGKGAGFLTLNSRSLISAEPFAGAASLFNFIWQQNMHIKPLVEPDYFLNVHGGLGADHNIGLWGDGRPENSKFQIIDVNTLRVHHFALEGW